MKCVIPCGGRGLRFLPITKEIPKEILPIVDVPVLSYIVQECVQSHADEIIIVISPSKTVIKDYFTSHRLYDELLSEGKVAQANAVKQVIENKNIVFVTQNKPKGLADAVLQTYYYVGDEPFGLLLGDDLMTYDTPPVKQLHDAGERCDGTVVGVQQCLTDDITKYGVAVPFERENSKLSRVKRFVEKPPLDCLPSRLACYGRYYLKDIFGYIKNLKPTKTGETLLTDALSQQCEQDKVFCLEMEGNRYDMGDKFSSIKAAIELSLKRSDFGEELKQYILQLSKSL